MLSLPLHSVSSHSSCRNLTEDICAGAFLLLAGAGNLTKAVGKGLGKPSFRIIQNHFAQENNLGDISAKEEVHLLRCAALACRETKLRSVCLSVCLSVCRSVYPSCCGTFASPCPLSTSCMGPDLSCPNTARSKLGLAMHAAACVARPLYARPVGVCQYQLLPLQVWEVAAQLMGLAISVGVLRSIEASHTPG